ncbi:MAG: hypothetical protein DRP42_00320 [Tenericutes bacterium]|nr:MAG: hypothetical protein DRP42_00320 [Mycoplasmatota bacterium]
MKGVEIFPLADFKERLHNSQGVVAEVEDYKYLSVNELLEKAKGKHIFITDKVTDPQNLGAIIRSIAAFGHGGLIIPKHEQVGINGTVIKTSAGTAFTVDIAESNSLIQLVKKLKDSGY